ncbi:bifunctional antitoxin/transcriptional repressor RelB [Caballeronia calidae]|uniref:Bifunctional antitoxin/transcriptional repressor RelB n=1 Tax=Caballeronia calidae TaxID=1777139 RepID=A0A158DM50_9BURK|nr:type II toxin-antitoxin system RelB/DinJ family antitoxin [Caballeronia calidae]SAK95266.1 bifunctional antitoxin/transcriptional repressor RelB [Caballeronia calidae]
MSRYQEVSTSIDPALKASAYEVLAEMDIKVSDFLRSAMIHLVEKRAVPFDIKRVRPSTRREEVAV